MSDDSVARWNWTSGRESDGSVRANMPPWLMPTAIGPRAGQRVARAHRHRPPPRFQRVVGRDRLRAAEDRAHLQVVLQVLAHAWRAHGRPERRASAAAAAGPTPESCRSCGDCMAPAATITSRRAAPSRRVRRGGRRRRARAGLRTRSAAPARRSRRRDSRAIARRPQIGNRGRAAQAVPRRQLVIAGAFLRRAVEILVARNAELRRGGDPRLDELVLRADVRRPQRAVGAMPFGSRHARCARACGNTAARPSSPSRRSRARPSDRSRRDGRGCR